MNRHRFNPSRGGHAPGRLRGFFIGLLDLDEDLVQESWSRRMRDDMDPLAWVAGQLHNCTDIMPFELCQDLGLLRGSTYAQGARRVLSNLADPASVLSRQSAIRRAIASLVQNAAASAATQPGES
jgi:hypothetical protein